MNRPDLFRWGVSQIVREEQERHADHPSPGRIAAYQRGELSVEESAALVEHLGLCADCTGLALEAAAFFAPEDGEEEEDEGELSAEWRRLRSVLGESLAEEAAETEEVRSAAAPGNVVPIRPPRPPLIRRLGFAYGLAAAFAVLALGIGLFERPVAGPRPRANEGSYDLPPARPERGEEGKETEIDLSAPNSSAHLIFDPPAGTLAAGAFRLRWRSDAGKIVWEEEGFQPDALGAVHLGVPRGAFPAGRYRVELLLAAGAGHEAPVAVYRVAIRE